MRAAARFLPSQRSSQSCSAVLLLVLSSCRQTSSGGNEVSETSASERVAIDVETLPGIGYDLVHNGRLFITSLQLRATGARPEHDVRVRVVRREGDTVIAGPWEREFPTVTAAGLALEPDLSLDPVFSVAWKNSGRSNSSSMCTRVTRNSDPSRNG